VVHQRQIGSKFDFVDEHQSILTDIYPPE